MPRLSLFVALVLSSSLLACTTTVDDDPDPTGSGPEDNDVVVPEAGTWTIVTTGWANDDCNAEQGLQPPKSLTMTEVTSSAFTVSYYDDTGQVGNSTVCSHTDSDVFSCEAFKNGFSFTDIDAAIDISGVGKVTVTSATTASGKAEFILTCTGADCDEVAKQTNSGSVPCETTLNWTATAD